MAIIILLLAKLSGKVAKIWFLSTFGETGQFGGFTTFPRTHAGRGDHAIAGENLPNSLRLDCHLHGITKSGHEPEIPGALLYRRDYLLGERPAPAANRGI